MFLFSSLGVAVALGLLIVGSYFGWSTVLLAPCSSLIVVIFQGLDGREFHPVAELCITFMIGFAGFMQDYYLLFLLGSAFGIIMKESNSAIVLSRAICKAFNTTSKHSKRTSHNQSSPIFAPIFSVVLSCIVLTYGGISLFVVVFAVWPVAKEIFTEAGLALSLVPATISLGSFTLSMTAMPGTPSVQNLIPTGYFGTTSFAAPVLGLIASVLMLVFGMIYLVWTAKRGKRNEATLNSLLIDSEAGVDGHEQSESSTEQIGTEDEARNKTASSSNPSTLVAILPLILVLGCNALFTVMLRASDLSFLAEYGVTADDVIGTWSVILALTLGCVVSVALNRKRMKETSAKNAIMGVLNRSVKASFGPIMSGCAVVAFGAVVQNLDLFAQIVDNLTTLSEEGTVSPVVLLAVTVFCLCGLVGSASGGLRIALDAVGPLFLAQAQAQGIDPQIMHRVSSISSGLIDTLPMNPSIVTALLVCGFTHKEAYAGMFVTASVVPFFTAIITVMLALAGVC
eukprot:gnl/Dysnectes_brevis/2562_a3086_905.p1 GENE.gnl/Dysnectes_brevis/2562_a3086_905~~gnl/Dysnectes_brevis/2562_a3086_905.p1  ORF type:complete len:512 (-),score=101.59 gnl/Dysnectes_brevis/2562_a3086_905:593-2128(-)